MRYSIVVPFMLLFSFSLQAQQAEMVHKWLSNSFVPVSPDDSSGFPNAYPEFDGKTVVGFGEATHGTREFRKAFVQLAKDLVRNKGFNVVLLAECGFIDTYHLNDYVINGREHPLTFNRNQSVIDEDLKAFAVWLKEFNQGKEVRDRVWLVGADVLFRNSIATNALQLVEEFDVHLSDYHKRLLAEWAFLGNEYDEAYFASRSLIDLTRPADSISNIISDAAKERKLTFRQQYLLQGIASLSLSIQFNAQRSKSSTPRFVSVYNKRDSAMFRNAMWIADHRPNARMVVFGHNGHIEKDFGNTSLPMTTRFGHLLSARYSSSYFAIGTEAGRGEFFYQGRISGRKDRLGTIMVQSRLGTGLLINNRTPAIARFLDGRFTMTYGTSGPLAGSFARYEHISSAFDAIYFTPISTISSPLATSRPLEDFSLRIPVDITQEVISSSKPFDISIMSTHADDTTYHQRSLISVSVIFLNKNKRFAGFRARTLTSGKETHLQAIVPPDAHSAIVNITGRGMQSVTLDDLQINNNPVLLHDIVFSSTSFVMKHHDDKTTIDPDM